ncbi:MAG TPA: MFS transporter [Chloroflexia bacterium]|nr:MFS transporter [Chloroflexia bacterium]
MQKPQQNQIIENTAEINLNKISGETDPVKARNIILLLAASVSLMMTGYGIVMPVMAKRLAELGAGVDILGFMAMAFAIGQFLLAPFMGGLADRFGRKPLILVALAGTVLANLAFLLVSSSEAYIGVRFFQGAIGAGLLPASMGIVGDIFPENKRAQWVGILMGSYGIGFIFGPGIGGFLYDSFGFVAPFGVSAILALLALIFSLIVVPETRTREARLQARHQAQERKTTGKQAATLPRPLYIFLTLLALDFLAVFAFAFIEPQLAFYIYQERHFTTSQFGLLVSLYGLATVIGQLGLGRLSDRIGRKPLIVAGFVMNAIFYIGLTQFTDYILMLGVSAIAGLGAALLTPALSSYYLDITAEEHRSRVMGIKESMAALGGAAGPFLVAIASKWTNAYGVFAIAAASTLLAALLALSILQARKQAAAASFPTVAVNPEEALEGELVA